MDLPLACFVFINNSMYPKKVPKAGPYKLAKRKAAHYQSEAAFAIIGLISDFYEIISEV